MAALKQSDRVGSISLTITDLLLAKFFVIEKPFSELEELDLLSRDDAQLTLPSIFQWGPRLRSLRLTRIAIPALSQLPSSTGLVDLRLYEIQHIPPEAFANVPSTMTRLQSLSVHFLSLPPRRNDSGLPPSSGEHVDLPALSHLKYQGASKYLESLVARIDAPRLGDVDITFFKQPTLEALQLGRFIERIESRRQLSQADILFSRGAISIRFSQPDAPTRLGLRIPGEQIDWQLSSMTQILYQFSHFLSCVENLGINMTEPPSRQVDVGHEPWLNLIRSFDGAKHFRVAGELATDILRAMCPAGGEHPTVLPALCDIRIRRPLSMYGPLWDAIQSLNTSRWLSGTPVLVYTAQYSCHLCNTCTKEQKHLRQHLKSQHQYRIVCSFCAEFEWSGYAPRKFQEHLESKHPGVAPIPERTSSLAYESLTTVQRRTSSSGDRGFVVPEIHWDHVVS